jgi:hypothetical protein
MNNKENFYTLKKLIYLHDIVIKFEKSEKQIKFLKIFKSEKVIVSLSALAWKKENYKDYKRYFSEIEISNKEFASLCEKEIKETLICDIFQQVIKNNIMML